MTLLPEEDRAIAPDAEVGPSEDLPEEYKPYSVIPWDQIPDDARESVLNGVKAFHGGLTKHQQELADLRKQFPELQKRSQILDQMISDPRFRAMWEQAQRPAPPPSPQESGPNLTEHVGADAAKAIQDVVERLVSKRVEEVTGRLDSLRHDVTASKASQDLSALRVEAERNGWPSPDEKLTEMYNLVSSGVPDVQTAYKLAVFNDLPKVVEHRTRESVLNELKKKADASVPPGNTPPGRPSPEQFSGRDATLRALKTSMRELGISSL